MFRDKHRDLLYLVNSENKTINVFDSTGQSQGLLPVPVPLDQPMRMVVSKSGTIWIADTTSLICLDATSSKLLYRYTSNCRRAAAAAIQAALNRVLTTGCA